MKRLFIKTGTHPISLILVLLINYLHIQKVVEVKPAAASQTTHQTQKKIC